MLSMSHSGFFWGIWCTPMVSSLCDKKCSQSQITWIGVSTSSPQSLQDTTSPSGGFLLWFTMVDFLRRNANPVRNLTILPIGERACFNNWLLFWQIRGGVPDFGLSEVIRRLPSFGTFGDHVLFEFPSDCAFGS
jgi:hypothetical protein